MPTYEYKCRKCQRLFEVVQNMSAPLLTECEVCGGKVKRLIGAGAGIIFKGTGFYCTDYKKPTGSAGSAATEAPRASAASESKPAGESKPASESKPGGESRKTTPEKTSKTVA